MTENTTYGENTEHGSSIPHKYPEEETKQTLALKSLSNKLYPTGRVWAQPEKSDFKRIHEAINLSFARYFDAMELYLDGIFPDNENFTEEDAELWEYRLGLITSDLVDLETRKKSIKRKMGHPNNIKARQHRNFIENQLRLSGFDVRVYENLPPYRRPQEIASLSLNDTLHSDEKLHGSILHGSENFDLIANSLDEFESYSIGDDSNLWSTFFIGGNRLGDYASIKSSRLREFKETVIKLKPAHMVAFLFINFTQ